jgi:hypothetical protein
VAQFPVPIGCPLAAAVAPAALPIPVGNPLSSVVVLVRFPLPRRYPLSSRRSSPGAVGEAAEQAERRHRAAAKGRALV